MALGVLVWFIVGTGTSISHSCGDAAVEAPSDPESL